MSESKVQNGRSETSVRLTLQWWRAKRRPRVPKARITRAMAQLDWNGMLRPPEPPPAGGGPGARV